MLTANSQETSPKHPSSNNTGALIFNSILIAAACIGLLIFLWTLQNNEQPLTWESIQPNEKYDERNWRYIVMHHSGTSRGNTAAIEKTHSETNNWEGIGYHFVVGNGNGMKDGKIDITYRWDKQRHGAHASVKEFNEFGVGVCLIGNFNNEHPSNIALLQAEKLCAILCERYPTLNPERIIGHSDVKSTDCPGKHFPLENFRARVQQRIEWRQKHFGNLTPEKIVTFEELREAKKAIEGPQPIKELSNIKGHGHSHGPHSDQDHNHSK